ncbi:hypothetical protein DYH09_03295 [bacterium CPR1]|nr:hypothetical protein [bacterium CPR1]
MEILSNRSDSEAPGVARLDDLDRLLANARGMFAPPSAWAASGSTAGPAATWSSQDGWNLKLGQSAQNVLRHQLIKAPPEVVSDLRAGLSSEYGRAVQQQVQLSPVVESLVRAALGDVDDLPPAQEQGATGSSAFSAQPGGMGAQPGSLSGGFNGNIGFSVGESQQVSGNALAPDAVSGPADMQGWGQGAEGNCAAVATIKAATDAYGDQLFRQVTRLPDGGYRITMQDGVTVEVSGQELSMARQQSNFTGSGPGLEQATVAYAAMARRAQLEGHEGSTSYAQALNSLADGDNPYDSARFLGLSNQVVQVDPRTLSGQDSVVAWNASHAVFVDNVRATDSYGTARGFDGTDTRGRGLTTAFTFAPLRSSGVASVPAAANNRPAARPESPPPARNVYQRHFHNHMSNGKKGK